MLANQNRPDVKLGLSDSLSSCSQEQGGYNSDMLPKPLPPPVLIQNQDSLQHMAKALASEARLAVDTESNSLYAYRERVCLIQISVPGTDYLVDPLALPDLSPLGPLFANPSIEKVFHAAEYDLACLKRDFDFAIVNLFDTRVAIRTLGRKRTGLRDILAEEFGVQLNKRLQRADWGKRPLRADLLDYARLDTHYLLPLRDRLETALHAAGCWEEACESFSYLATIGAHVNGFDPQGFWHVAHGRQLTPEQTAVLREVYLFREQTARRLDRPPFKVMGDKTLLAITLASPTSLEALGTLHGVTPRQARRYGKGLLAAVARGRRSPPPQRPSSPRRDEPVIARYERLRQWRKKVAQSRSVDSDLILPREVLWEIARVAPQDPETLRRVMAALEWRFQTYGEEILKTLRG
jgi:ribonuclease D